MEFYEVVAGRRDVRTGFRPDEPVDDAVLARVLGAAHAAPSVGYSQPWDFVLVRDRAVRERVHELVARARDAYAASLPRARAAAFAPLPIQAILETPLNVVVTCDPTRGGRHTLGRHTQPQMAPYSTALAVQNLWLAARAEDLGVGWVSFLDDAALREIGTLLGLPAHLEIVAYLCVGHVERFPDEPELVTAGWARRRPLAWAVHHERYGQRAVPGEAPVDLLAETLAAITPASATAQAEARDRLDRMTKPRGSLGELEELAVRLAGIADACPPPVPEPAVVAIVAADHGCSERRAGPVVAELLAGSAPTNALARQVGAELCVVDVGLATPVPARRSEQPGLLPRRIADGTADVTGGPAMSRAQAVAAIEVGIETARDLVVAGNRCLVAAAVDGMGPFSTVALVRGFAGADPADPVGVLADVGGFEHAALVGFVLGAAAMRVPVVLDGVDAGVAALVAAALCPAAVDHCVAGQRSAEPGHDVVLARLGLVPLLDLGLRSGNGSGALLAVPVLVAAARALSDVATFDAAGVADKDG